MKIQMQTKNNPSFSSSYQITTPAGRAGSETLNAISNAIRDCGVTASLKLSDSTQNHLRISSRAANLYLSWELKAAIKALRQRGQIVAAYCKPSAHLKSAHQLRTMQFKPNEVIFTELN